ncbi:DUF1501 domain-containing protein [Prosthecobacter dejongeii]|uniref:Uncharacterized protein (DUF1501 family) n=1 Tax=Prosthecobacter dejongeii TaxID=48465 RepID=A0A7W7YH53_9BACT|nr:DUF1501 domain-containing protein [Prosthecobacter dejongeii]MBB5036115.1 uncharacterized protein (DUF1501 family) [Prosthecobacter dejongeii]
MPSLTRRALLSKLAFATPTMAEVQGDHTLIHIFLRGGADTLNLWVPYADDRYYRLRPALAIPAPGKGSDAALRLNDHYALHPALKPLEAAYQEGRLGAVQSVGVDNTSGSHFECQDQMEHGDSMHGIPAGGGWLGRYLRLRAGAKASPLSAVAIGTTLPESLRGAPAVSVLEHLEDISLKAAGKHAEEVVTALQSLYGADVSLLGERGLETLDLFRRLSALQQRTDGPDHGATYPSAPFGSGLREIARLVKARLGLQVACIDLGGWDTHFFQGNSSGTQAQQIKLLAEGIAALETDLEEHRARYTIMVTTEFGRRVYENASLGTDHGRGFTLMALGDRVKGGQVIGGWPIQADDDVNVNTPGPGGLIAETDYRQVFAEVLRGSLGLTTQEATQVFPGIVPQKVGLM